MAEKQLIYNCKSKKSPFDLACEKLEELSSPECAMFQTTVHAHEWKQYYQKEADIPDGWVVVKEIYKTLRDFQYHANNIDEAFIFSRCANNVMHYLKDAEIDVDDEICHELSAKASSLSRGHEDRVRPKGTLG